MNKKVVCLGLALLLCSCSAQRERAPQQRDFSDNLSGMEQLRTKTKTAMLLPLSGQTAVVGENFQNAALIAGLERTTESTEVLFYDTKGTPEGTILAYQAAKADAPDVIVGPVFAPEVKALRDQDPNKPVLSFTSDTSVLGDNVYSLALLIPQQINRLVDFACQNGQRRFALIGPRDKTGEIVVKSFEKAVDRCPGMKITQMSLYPENTTNLTSPVTQIAPPLIDSRKKNLTDREKELLKNPSADRLSFDALFIFEQGVKLQQLVSTLYYYDITPQLISFYGLATLRQSTNPQLEGTYFADLPQSRLQLFQEKYRDAFQKEPIPVAAFGYDAVALVSFLSQEGALNEKALTDKTGYRGTNGRFRLNRDGTNDRLLEVFRIEKGYIETVAGAPLEFE